MKKILFLCVLFIGEVSHAQRWTLLSFACDAGGVHPQFGTQYPDWNQVLSGNTQWVNSGGVCGITDQSESSFLGVRGSTPIPMAKGGKIILTLVNRTGNNRELWTRVSVTDADSPSSYDRGYYNNENPPNGPQPGSHWHTGTPEGGPRNIGGGQTVRHFLNVTDADSVLALHSNPSAGNRTLINVAFRYQASAPGDFVLTGIEYSDEADLAPPPQITDLQSAPRTISQEADATAVELSWSAPADFGTNGGPASGISRYFVYRNGELYALVNGDWMRRYPDHIGFTDNQVVPGASYTYEVTALDQAATGMYPVDLGWLRTMNRRCGNESPRSNAVTVSVPGWTSPTLINPHADLQYQGAFRLPNDGEWGYGLQALTSYPSGNASPAGGEWSGSLYGAGHDERLNIGEFSVPAPVVSSDINQLPRARSLRGFADPYPAAYGGGKVPAGSVSTVRRLAYHPGDAGTPEGIYYTICRYYSGAPASASFGRFNLALTQADGPWHAGAAPGNAGHLPFYYTAKLLMSAPTSWAQGATGGRSLLMGLGWDIAGVGRPSAGPTFAAVAPAESGSLPSMNGVVSAVRLLRYQSADDDNFQWLSSKWELNWNQNNRNNGAAWITGEGKDAVVISAQSTSGDEWYGSDEGASDNHILVDLPNGRDNRNMFKGPNSSRTHQVLKFYNPADFARTAAGTMPLHEPQPYARMDLGGLPLRGEARAVTFDPVRGRLFLAMLVGSEPIVHVWTLNTAPAILPARTRRLRVRP
jgi:hypothetical protein